MVCSVMQLVNEKQVVSYANYLTFLLLIYTEIL